MKYLLLIFCLILCSCRDVETIIGLCSNPPKLSKKELLFSAQGGVDSVIVNSTFWELLGGWDYDECKFISRESNPSYCKYNYCTNRDSLVKMECSWYSVTRIDGYTLIVSVDQNETGEERKPLYNIDLWAGNCSTVFSITQSAE